MTDGEWLIRISRARSEESLVEIRAEAKAAGEWNEVLHGACLDRLGLIKRPFGVDPGAEARIRADERLKVLREVRNLAWKLHRQEATQDPYSAGLSGPRIAEALTRLLSEQRGTVAAEAEQLRDEQLAAEYDKAVSSLLGSQGSERVIKGALDALADLFPKHAERYRNDSWSSS